MAFQKDNVIRKEIGDRTANVFTGGKMNEKRV